ncbi:MAG: phage portal protein [Aeromonas veronii]
MLLHTKSIGMNELTPLSRLISGSGTAVSYQTALADPTVQACVRIIAQTVGSIPLKLYKQQKVAGGTGKEWIEDTTSLMAHTITRKPNPRQTMNEMIEQMTAQLALYSESFGVIKHDASGRIISITPTNSPKQVSVIEAGDALIYQIATNDGKSIKPAMNQVLHLKDTAINTVEAIDKILNAKSSLGLSAAATANAESFYRQGVRAGGFISVEGKLSDEGFNKLYRQVNDAYAGNDSAHTIGLLEGGSKFIRNDFSMKEAEVLRAREGSIREIAALFGVPLELLGIPTGASRDVNRFFYNSCLQSIITKFENRLTAALPRGYAVKFDLNEYLRGDIKEAASVARELFVTGVIGMNEARVRVGMQPIHKDDIFAVETNNLTFGTIDDFCKPPKPEEVNSNEESGLPIQD